MGSLSLTTSYVYSIQGLHSYVFRSLPWLRVETVISLIRRQSLMLSSSGHNLETSNRFQPSSWMAEFKQYWLINPIVRMNMKHHQYPKQLRFHCLSLNPNCLGSFGMPSCLKVPFYSSAVSVLQWQPFKMKMVDSMLFQTMQVYENRQLGYRILTSGQSSFSALLMVVVGRMRQHQW